MMLLLLSMVLAVVPLLGIAYILYLNPVPTVDNLFMTLIALAVSGLFGLNALLELRRKFRGETTTAGGGGLEFVQAGAPPAGVLASGALREVGVVEQVNYFESSVGAPNRSLLALRTNGSSRLLPLLGDVRDQFPVGQRVEIIYRPGAAANTLVQRRYLK